MLPKKRTNEPDGALDEALDRNRRSYFYREVLRMRTPKWQATQVCEVNSLQSKRAKSRRDSVERQRKAGRCALPNEEG